LDFARTTPGNPPRGSPNQAAAGASYFMPTNERGTKMEKEIIVKYPQLAAAIILKGERLVRIEQEANRNFHRYIFAESPTIYRSLSGYRDSELFMFHRLTQSLLHGQMPSQN
jgi:hypothetical protein